MAGKIIWVHGMGVKPAPDVEKQQTWEALRQGVWCPIPEDSYEVAYWADVIHGHDDDANPSSFAKVAQHGLMPEAIRDHFVRWRADAMITEPFSRPRSETLLRVPARERADLELAYILARHDPDLAHHAGLAVRGWEDSDDEGVGGKGKRALLSLVDYMDYRRILSLPMDLVRAILDFLWLLVHRGRLGTFLARGFSLGSLLGDLEEYIDDRNKTYNGKTYKQQIVEQIRAHLEEVRGPKHDEPICIISQSMGCIVAFDAIKAWYSGCPTCDPPNHDLRRTIGSVKPGDAPICEKHRIETFITLGSPLGLEWVRDLVWRELGRQLEFPPNVAHWFNLYDRSDIVSFLDRSHADDFRTTAGSRVVVDREVRPNFDAKGRRDPHNWHGYLSSPELADIVSQFYLAQNMPDLRSLFVAGN